MTVLYSTQNVGNYQKNVFGCKPDVKSPDNHGWQMSDSHLIPVLMTQAPAPMELIELTVCQCKKSRCATGA